ncbi:MAG: TIM barrel protein [Clostridia bacterium]|nr:TIM barrel protein [Clostridia bacterium]
MKIDLCAFADEAADDLGGQIAALKRNNICKIELRSLSGTNVKDFSNETAEEAEAEFAASGISVWSIGSPIGKSDINGDFGEVTVQLNRVLELCEIFKCDKIRAFSFFTCEHAKARPEVLRRLKELVARAADKGVTLYHENEKDIFGDTAGRVQTLLTEVRGLKSVFDPANYVQVGESAENMVRVRKYADYYHIKDALRSGELVPAGEGDGDIPALIAELDRNVTLTLEPHLAVFSGYAAIDNHEMKNKYTFSSRAEAFDTAVNALKKLLTSSGFAEDKGCFIK